MRRRAFAKRKISSIRRRRRKKNMSASYHTYSCTRISAVMQRPKYTQCRVLSMGLIKKKECNPCPCVLCLRRRIVVTFGRVCVRVFVCDLPPCRVPTLAIPLRVGHAWLNTFLRNNEGRQTSGAKYVLHLWCELFQSFNAFG